ncbi:MAG: tRNA (N(6)-L-threonylcarbamoyladenosine(37)-C(2))-methylthiotransferase MtaB [Sphingobacteriales bacterium]|jgi:threonylcarbamoyladenosine tRNA methylthiotransferase MtaB|nr:tRNA (N(6)-L-threonylcarbamoyladenosine(37)-C(2))-methylthiotransferase MtaB [Sphingobacteriales bacterium]
MGSVSFHTLGCKLNFSETSTIARQFRDAGWSRVEFPGPADVVVVNTCSVTENADRECRTIVQRARACNSAARVIVVGCYAQLKPEEIARIPGVSLVLGAAEKFNVLGFLAGLDAGDEPRIQACEIDQVNTFVPSFSSGDRTRTFLKLQDGCDYQCTFCTIPLARGKSRSATVAAAVSQVVELVQKGVREIVLTGVNLGDFGIDPLSGQRVETFTQLVAALNDIAGLQRIRISSIEPNLLTEEVIRIMASSSRWMPHLHMPIQSGSDRILSQMRRRYRSALYEDKVTLIRSLMPHAAIGVDVIVGFPGESDSDFQETVDFLHRLPVSYLHVFTYSERENTIAVELPDRVDGSVRKQRNRILRILSAKKMHDFSQASIGSIQDVLFEEEVREGFLYGYTPNYIRVKYAYAPELQGKIVSCKIGQFGSDGLLEITPLQVAEPIAYS